MDHKSEIEATAGEWELIHNDHDSPIVEFNSNSSSIIRSDHFSLNPVIPNSISSTTSSSSSNSEIDRNFDDSYVANQIFPNPIIVSSSSSTNLRWNDSDSDNEVALIGEAADKEVVEVGFDSKVEEEDVVEEEKEVKDDDDDDMKRVVWWKVPFEVLKHWVNPFATIPLPLSVAAAAAFLGLLILGRRLYKMKRKTQTLKLNLALDDKKVSQLMGRVARLNEAFSVVRRVPIVRPSLPASTITLRPVMSMR